MRKPRDFDAELKTLEGKARTLKERKVRQLGELVIATGADALDVETLAGGRAAWPGRDKGHGSQGGVAQTRRGVLSQREG